MRQLASRHSGSGWSVAMAISLSQPWRADQTDQLPLLGARILGGPLVQREAPRSPLTFRALSGSSRLQRPLRAIPAVALPGCEGLPDPGTSVPPLVSVSGLTFCPRIGFLGFCLVFGVGVFEGDSLFPKLRCSGLGGWDGAQRGLTALHSPRSPDGLPLTLGGCG